MRNDKILMKYILLFIVIATLISCNEIDQNTIEQNEMIRQRFDSIDKELDSFNKKMQQDADSAIGTIDSLLMELDKKKQKK